MNKLSKEKINQLIQLYNLEKYLFDVIGKQAKKRGYLKFEEFYVVGMWKSARQKNRYLKNQKTIEQTTKTAFAINDEKEKIQTLCELSGVGIPTASAILSVVFPEKYPVIDVRCIEALNKLDYKLTKYISENTWLKYLEIMRRLAKEYSVTPRDMDMALFALHREMLNKDNYRNLYKKQ